MKFKWQNYNEFHSEVRWHDYVSVMINEFPILLVRRYDWVIEMQSTWLVQVLGFQFKCKCIKWSKTQSDDSAKDCTPTVQADSPWRLVADDPPPCDSSFILAADGRWMKARRGNKPVIVVEWLQDQDIVMTLEETGHRYWMAVPPNPLQNK